MNQLLTKEEIEGLVMENWARNARILIVDDEPHIVSELSEVLAEHEYEIDTALSGEEAIEKVKTNRPHLMLLDVRMPGKMGGPETLKRAKEIHPQMDVIMVTAVHDREMMKQAMEYGACDYITKPFDLGYLKTIVKARLIAMLD